MYLLLPSVKSMAVLPPQVRNKVPMLLLRLIRAKSTLNRTCNGGSLCNAGQNFPLINPRDPRISPRIPYRENICTVKPFSISGPYKENICTVKPFNTSGPYKENVCTVEPFNTSGPYKENICTVKSLSISGPYTKNISTVNPFNISRPYKENICTVKPLNILGSSRSFNSGVVRLNNGGDKGGGGTKAEFMSHGTRSTLYYIAAVGVLAFGLSYAAVPLYRIFCQAYSYGGTTQAGHDAEKVESMEKVNERIIRVRFNADLAASMTWNFRPQQSEIKVHPGETALAFYTAKNPTDHPVIGVSTYNVVPFDAGQYFNKIQCFCFEEQMLNPHEQVDMPVFFYIDPEFADDPKMHNVDLITLSYTFFEAREGLQLPMPQFSR